MKTQCAFCGTEIDRAPSEIKRSKTGNVYCNKSCANSMNNKLFKSGEKHPNYKTGISAYRKLKITDGCKCEDCGNKDVRVLEVHHLDRNRKNNKVENLVVLCANCHLIRHHNE